jgi:hypothetical protein
MDAVDELGLEQWEQRLSILLHGEAKEPETESPGQWADRAWKCPHKETKKIGYDIYCKSCGVYVRTEKDLPTDAREEWAEQLVVDPTRCVCGKPYGHLSACNPDPPTDAWEEYMARFPHWRGIEYAYDWSFDLKKWFYSMPR